MNARLKSILLPRAPAPAMPDRSQAAVLVPLVPLAGGGGPAEETGILFTVRTDRVATHKGQVSFPGGSIEPDEEPLAAALRETEEEVGLARETIEPLGWLGTFPTLTSGWEIRALVGRVPAGPLRLQPDEVARVFVMPLAELRATRAAQRRQPEPAPPVWPTFNHREGEHRYTIWGATARILAHLLDRIDEHDPRRPA